MDGHTCEEFVLILKWEDLLLIQILETGKHCFNPDFLSSNLGHAFCWKPIFGHERRKLLLFATYSYLTSKSIPSLALEPISLGF